MASIFSIPDEAENSQGHMVYVLTLVWSGLTAFVVSLGFFVFPDLWMRWLTFVSVSVFTAVLCLAINHRGHARSASWVLVTLLWLYMTVPSYTAGGMSAPGIIPQLGVILTAGFLLGRAGGFAIGAVTISADLALALLETWGLLPAPTVVHTPITRWITAIIPFSSVFAIQYYSTHRLRASVAALNLEVTKRNEAEQVKNKMLHNLEERVKELKTLYAVSRLLQKDDASPKRMYQDIVQLLTGGWQHTEITAVRLVIGDITYTTKNFRASTHSMCAEMATQKGTRLELEVVYLEDRPTEDEGPFLREERSLLNMLIELLEVDLDAREYRTELQEAAERLKRSEALLNKVTSQVPANTYMFTIDETGLTQTLFFNRGSDEKNHSIDLNDLDNASSQLLSSLHDEDKERWNDEMRRGYQTHTPISIQYRIRFADSWCWRWFRAIPEVADDGSVLWYGASHDISAIVDYIVSIEQMIFDISHVIRRPIASMMGMTKLLLDTKQSLINTTEAYENLHHIAAEIDTFIHELNTAYNDKRRSTTFGIDVTSLIDKRKSFFVRD